ncbi:unnamed protein product [Arctia plantaginis]|uniref:Uncharacterized protein n=1 Tax=Arctia plantaginis TaxID=874455 RepID=A0A8S1A3M9_ARCPL|nr:unnamed protein product [Arctia plantaginis]
MATNGFANTPAIVTNFDTIDLKSEEADNSANLTELNGNYEGGLCVPRTGHRLSIMEVECAKERTRLALLKQCSAIFKQGDGRYTKETLHRTFQDQVSSYYLLSYILML